MWFIFHKTAFFPACSLWLHFGWSSEGANQKRRFLIPVSAVHEFRQCYEPYRFISRAQMQQYFIGSHIVPGDYKLDWKGDAAPNVFLYASSVLFCRLPIVWTAAFFSPSPSLLYSGDISGQGRLAAPRRCDLDSWARCADLHRTAEGTLLDRVLRDGGWSEHLAFWPDWYVNL